MNVIKLGSKSKEVKAIQYFLIGQGYSVIADGDFGKKTQVAVKSYQKSNGLKSDGVIGNGTLNVMLSDGLALMPTPDNSDEFKAEFPKRPNFSPLETNSQRASVFGRFSYKSSPTRDNPERIVVTDGWADKNLETFSCPQLIKLGLSKSGNVTFHKKAKAQFLGLWADWEKANLLDRVKTWEGAYIPRFVRGSRSVLSNHAFGSAFDINYEGNELGSIPAKLGEKNCVRELVSLAHKWGFYWGGHFSRQDGMHFEIAKIF